MLTFVNHVWVVDMTLMSVLVWSQVTMVKLMVVPCVAHALSMVVVAMAIWLCVGIVWMLWITILMVAHVAMVVWSMLAIGMLSKLMLRDSMIWIPMIWVTMTWIALAWIALSWVTMTKAMVALAMISLAIVALSVIAMVLAIWSVAPISSMLAISILVASTHVLGKSWPRMAMLPIWVEMSHLIKICLMRIDGSDVPTMDTFMVQTIDPNVPVAVWKAMTITTEVVVVGAIVPKMVVTMAEQVLPVMLQVLLHHVSLVLGP